ncbi:enoyl-CoA hydratase/isomerase family protein [Paraburkholderia susongensis]|uniref:Enoyl-CoA hydratase/carnithine racemase n=1 Tax=Paraburkholderia susongensis TaxID=1515439 RepID=A0A1X7KLM4_9BURK|nr:enoyl-CoA hydratase/isomerase family protein [Paraburkholderia susongensis]SMG41940.1 Enoyl-CoA hydratase/carnithine racemase [Paraburkholderia susongensis]
MTDFNTLRYEVNAPIAVVTLNRPERLNALGKQSLLDINAALDRAEADETVRAIVVTGAGKAFSSGFDLKEQMDARPEGEAIWREILDRDFKTTMRFWDCPKPTIAAVHGACLAGAFEIALACDMTIAAQSAIFGEPELKFGAGIVTMLLPWMANPKQAKEIILSGLDRITAVRAHEFGFVNRVVPEGEHLNEALRIAHTLSVIDPSLVQSTKRAINHSFEVRGMKESLQHSLDIDHAIESAVCPDKTAFMEVARAQGMREAIRWRDRRFAD